MDATVDAARSPRDFRLATPANWFDLDLNPATRRSSIQTLVEKRSGSHPQTAETRRQLVSLLEQAAKDAAEGGAVFASMLSDVIQGRPVAASLLVSTRQDREAAAEGDLEGLAERLRHPPDGEAAGDLSIVDLEAGPALRVRRRSATELRGAGGSRVEVESLQYFVPIPGTAILLVLGFSTPNLAVADAFIELFDAIAESLHWRW